MRKVSVALAGIAISSLLVFAQPAIAKRHSNTATATGVNKSNVRGKRTNLSSNSNANSNANANANANSNANANANVNSGSTVAIVPGACDSLTDGDALGCEFTGNINTSTNGNSSYLLAEGAYNAAFDPNISLTPLADLDPGNLSGDGFSITLDPGGTSGTFTFDAGIDLLYYAVKAGNGFVVYEFTGSGNTGTWTTADLTVGNGQTPSLSHIIFFGTPGGGVPEPATWAMMLIGFAAVGAFVRRRRAQVATPQPA